MNLWKWMTLIVALVGAIAGCGRGDVVEREYAEGASLRSDGVFDRGWVSPALPAGAKQIKLATNMDTNETWLRFSITAGDLGALARACPPADARAQDLPRVAAGSWWPGELVEGGFKPNAFRYYRCSDGGMFASGPRDGLMYFWRRQS
jgi:hypothetical protein